MSESEREPWEGWAILEIMGHRRLAGLVCRVDRRTKHGKEVVEKVRTRFPDITYQTEIRENVRLAECPSQGGPITAYSPTSPGAEDYRKLAEEVIAQESAGSIVYGQVANG